MGNTSPTIIEMNTMHSIINLSQTMRDISKILADIAESLKELTKKEGK